MIHVVGFSVAEAQDIEMVLEIMPFVMIDVICETEGKNKGYKRVI